MSGSSRRTSSHSHSRQIRPQQDLDHTLTGTSSQNLALTSSGGNQRFPVPISPFQVPDPQYNPQTYTGSDPSSTYLHPSYGTDNYSSLPSVTYAENPLPYQPVSVPQLPSRSSVYSEQRLPPEPPTMPGPEMSFAYMPTPLPGNHTGQRYDPTLASMQSYYNESQSRSMSDSYGPTFLPNLAFSPTSTEEREIARQLRRVPKETRRDTKMRVRKMRLPSIAGAKQSTEKIASGSVDFSLAAPSLPSSYVSDPIERSYQRSRPSIGSAHGDYGSVVPNSSASYNDRPYQPVYSMGTNTVNPLVYSGPQSVGPQAPPSIGIYPSYQPDRRSPLPPSLSPNPENAPRAVSPRLVDTSRGRERPQCWDHGCNGREFSTFSNLLRHQREKSGTAAKSYCPNCHAEFTRTTARNGHMEHGKCKPRRASDDQRQ